MKIDIGNIIFSQGKLYLIAKDKYDNNYPYQMIDLQTSEVDDAYPTLESIVCSFMIDGVIDKEQQIFLLSQLRIYGENNNV